jgi:hypothetical protein
MREYASPGQVNADLVFGNEPYESVPPHAAEEYA